MTNEYYIENDKKYIANTYKRQNVVLARGKGSAAYDADGKKYIDFTSGIGVNSLGYCNDNWVSAVVAQAQTLQHTSNIFYSVPDVILAEKLCKATGYSKVFFANSGAEANEGAIKAARKYGADNKGKDCVNIITLQNSFHGRTIAALEATGQDVFHKNFYPFTGGFKYVPINDKAALENAFDNTVCAVMIEVVQGEGGVVAADKEYVKFVWNFCKEKDILFIVDEVQTGVGRTGTLLASRQFGVIPDITTLAKGLAGGLPIGAVLMNEKTGGVFGFSDHGSTFGGNPVACAGGVAVLDELLDRGVLAEVSAKADYFRKELADIPAVEDVSGLGLMIGITLNDKYTAADVAAKCAENGLLVLTAKTKIRFLPPLNITKDEIDEGLSIFKKVLG